MTDERPGLAIPACRLPPAPESVPASRRFVRQALAGVPDDLLDTAELLVSELATNAVLHARTEFEIRVWAAPGRVHALVSDAAGELWPAPGDGDPEATTGRGLAMVETLATRFGVEATGLGKSVWFELWAQTDECVGGIWESPTRPLPGASRAVLLHGVPLGLLRAGQRHREALLRECDLLGAGGALGLDSLALADAQATSAVLRAAVSNALAVDPTRSCSLELRVPVSLAAGLPRLGEVLEWANRAAREGLLLTRPVLPEIRAFRNWMFAQIAGQLRGEPAGTWGSQGGRVVPGEDLGELPSGAVRTGRSAMVVASDDNRIVAVNAALTELLGWAASDIIGQRLVALMPPEWRERHVAGFTNFLLTGESRILGRAVTVPALHRAGHCVEVALTLRVTQTDDGHLQFVATLERVVAAS